MEEGGSDRPSHSGSGGSKERAEMGWGGGLCALASPHF